MIIHICIGLKYNSKIEAKLQCFHHYYWQFMQENMSNVNLTYDINIRDRELDDTINK